MKCLNVMVVDDSLITSKKLSAMLSEMGHQVIRTAASGSEALAAYPIAQPDLVTMDITMPDMDGIEATKRIVEHDPNALIIMVTSHGQEKMVLDALKAGAKGYVLKPIRPDKLQDVIVQAVLRR